MQPFTLYEPFTLYDPNTDECPVPQELLKSVDQLSDDEVLDLLDRASKIQADLAQVTGALKAELIQRMTARDATALDTPSFTAKLERNVTYKYDIPRLLRIGMFITQEQFDAAIKQEYKPNKTELNKLVKYGGEIKAIIDASITPVEGTPSLKFDRKPEPAPVQQVPEEGFAF